jgi:CRP-like cAMP-binding protein
MDGPELMSNFPIFSGVSRNHLFEIGQYLETLECHSGETVFREGEKASKLYGVLSGEVELLLVAKDKIMNTDVRFEDYTRTETEIIEREIVVDSVESGEIFGWSSLTPSGQFTSKAVCVEPTKLFALSATNLRGFFNHHPQIGYLFMERLTEIISNRLTNRTEKLIESWCQAFNVNRI